MADLDTPTTSVPDLPPPGREPADPPADLLPSAAVDVFVALPDRSRRLFRGGAGGGDPPGPAPAVAGRHP